MSPSLPHLTLTTSTRFPSPFSSTSPIFLTVSPAQTRSMILDLYLPCDVPRQSGGSTQILSLTGYEPKSVEIKVIETEAIKPAHLEPRRIELDRNLGTDPYQHQERFMRNSISEDTDEFGKVGAETSHLQSQIHSDYDSAESIADSDLEDGELRKCWLHHCICKVERIVNPLECQLHRGNLLQCFHQEMRNLEINSRVLFSKTLTR